MLYLPGGEVASAVSLQTPTAAVPDKALPAGARVSVRPGTMLEAEHTASSKAIAAAAAALSARLLMATKPARLTSCTTPAAAAVVTGGCCPSNLLQPLLKLFDLVTGALVGAITDAVTDAVAGA